MAPAVDSSVGAAWPRFIEVEIGTYCNRRCAWCPNGRSDRGQRHEHISATLWRQLVNELGALPYGGWLAVHNYNEPLADPYLDRRLVEARAAVPEAGLAIYTNGDLLTRDRLHELADLGVDELRITLYPDNRNAFQPPSRATITRYLAGLGFDPDACPPPQLGRRGLELRFHHERLRLHLIVPDIGGYTDRAGKALPAVLGLAEPRRHPCHLPRIAAAIDHLGNVKMCCQIYDVTTPEQAKYVLGNLTVQTFEQIWRSPEAEALRERLAQADFTGLEACQHCSHRLSPEQELDVAATTG